MQKREVIPRPADVTPKELVRFCQMHGIEEIDLVFPDIIGEAQHFTIPLSDLPKLTFFQQLFEEGIGYDGSSILGQQGIEESDMLLIPDPETAALDPVARSERPTLSLICLTRDPFTRKPLPSDPRWIAVRTEELIRKDGFDEALFGPEIEFFFLKRLNFEIGPNFQRFEFDSDEAWWNTGRKEDGHLPRIWYKQGYFPLTRDLCWKLRSDVCHYLRYFGINPEVHHHEVATAGQVEIDMEKMPLLKMGDAMLRHRWVCKRVAEMAESFACFMPKILSGDPMHGGKPDNGSGMHVHSSLKKRGKNAFFDPKDEYAHMSNTAYQYIDGLLYYARALCAITNPTVVSYKRVVPHAEAPVYIGYSRRNRSALVRLVTYHMSSKKLGGGATRVELRSPDPLANPYLCLSAIYNAGRQGFLKKLEVPKECKRIDRNVYESGGSLPMLPGSLEAAIVELKSKQKFLTQGSFTAEVLAKLIEVQEQEIHLCRTTVSPIEFALYGYR